MTAVTMPWAAWYGDTQAVFSLPDAWRVVSCPPRDAPDVGREGVLAALGAPIGVPPLRELVARRRSAVVVVDDLTRPTPAHRFLPNVLRSVEEAGVAPEHLRILVGTGAGRPLVRDDLRKKLGGEVVDRYEVINHHPYEHLEDLGVSSRGTPICINRYFLDADLRIAVGCIMPDQALGFTGGAAHVVLGIAGIDTLTALASQEHGSGPGAGGGSEQRADMEEIAERVGLDLVMDVVPTASRGIAGLFVGEPVAAYRAGVALAREVFATAMPADLVDVVVTNAYPRDTEFLTADAALSVLGSAWRAGNRVLRPGGTTVVTAACPEGRGFHGLYGPGGRLYASLPEPQAFDRVHSAGPVYYAPGINALEAGGMPLRNDWNGLIAQLLAIHGRQATVAVFPLGALQLAS